MTGEEARAAPRRPPSSPVTAAEAAAALAEHAWRAGQAFAARGDLTQALRWLDRARRISPRDPVVTFTLATVRLSAGDAAGAVALFAPLAGAQDTGDAWAGLAAAAYAMGDLPRAEVALAAALSRNAPTDAVRGLAPVLAVEAGRPGWCGLDAGGTLVLHGEPDEVALDDRAVAPGATLPADWRRARSVMVSRAGRPFLGSPLRPDRIARIEGVVEATPEGGVEGWAWHPSDPARDPVLQIVTAGRTWKLVASEPARVALSNRLFVRPRRVALAPDAVGGVVRVLDAAGRDLLGSPLDPDAERRGAVTLAYAAAGRTGMAPGHAAMPVLPVGRAPASRPRRRAVDIVVPIYRGVAATLACLASVLDTVPPGARVVVVDDASPEPELAAAVRALAASGRICLIARRENHGFPAAANAGLRAAGRRDVVLLNSDTLVPKGWLERLRDAAYSAPDIGSATPLSSDATLASYPAPSSPMPDAAGTRALDRLAGRANGDLTVEVPTGVGFCLYLRRDCLDDAGLFRELPFAQGYGEENDWSLRARALGWRHVVAAGVFVAHAGGGSFGSAREHLQRRNLAVLNRLHPGYDALIAAHEAADPLAPARRRMDALRWRAGRCTSSAILVAHEGGGGVDRVVARRCAVLRAEGRRAVVLRPREGRLCLVGEEGDAHPNLAYRPPDELPHLARLLRADRPTHVELHHLLGHDPAVLDLARALGVPYDVVIHDYALFCPRIALLSYGRRYCGEPDAAGCDACVADLGSNLDEPLTVPGLIARSAALLAGARRVIAPSEDAAARIARHFPGARPTVEPWERDPAPAPPSVPARSTARQGVRRIAVVGAIGAEKGYDVLLACVRDVRARDLPIEFVVVGPTEDDARLLAAGPVFVTGRYAEAEAVALIRAQAADLAFLPSVWPETWCFALTRAWDAGLSVAAFDLGAPAERIRRAGRGWLLPLGLPAGAINAALLGFGAEGARLAPPAVPRHSPAHASTR